MSIGNIAQSYILFLGILHKMRELIICLQKMLDIFIFAILGTLRVTACRQAMNFTVKLLT